jgi:GAF domain-containing protein
VEAYGLRSCLIVPMLRQEGVIGVMTLDYSDRPARFQDWQQDLAQAIAGQLAWPWRTRGCTTRRRSG